METSILKFILRKELNKSENKRLIRDGYIISNINQTNAPSIAIAVLKSDFKLLLKEGNKKDVLKLEGPDGVGYDAKIRDIQLTDLVYEIHHVDFQVV